MPRRIPCGSGVISVYEKTRRRGNAEEILYRASFPVRQLCKKLSAKPECKRYWGPWSANINSTVPVLLPKLKLKQTEKDAVWAEVSNGSHTAQPAMSHRSQIGTLPPAAVFFPKAPFEGIVRTYSRAVDKKVRMKLSRLASKGRLYDSLLNPIGMQQARRRSRPSKRSASAWAAMYRL